jgi:hypothetical protein
MKQNVDAELRSEPNKEDLQSIEVKRVFPLKKGDVYQFEKGRDEITTFIHPKFGEIITTKFRLSNRFKFRSQVIETGINRIIEETNSEVIQKMIDFKPIKQSADNENNRTCTVATAANIVRALMPGMTIVEQDILDEIEQEHFSNNGELSLDIALNIIEDKFPISHLEFTSRDPYQIKVALDQGSVIQATWESHAKLISGYFTNGHGEVFVIINDPLPNEPEQYAVNLEELFTIDLSCDNLSLAAFQRS